MAEPSPSSASASKPGSAATGTGRGGAACGDGADVVVQPAAASSAQAMIAATDGERVMWVIYLEAAVALVLVLFVVWWTMRGRK
jgi:hypothetical protein